MKFEIPIFEVAAIIVYLTHVCLASPAKCSPGKERIRRALLLDQPHVRTRRAIEVHPDADWQVSYYLKNGILYSFTV